MTRLSRLLKKTKWENLRSVKPISRKFGFDRGTPIDRIYIEKFLENYRNLITGDILEISESTYSKKYGQGDCKYEVLHFTPDNPHATIIGDLTNYRSLPENRVDCFICTQTLNFIYDYKAAIAGIRHILKKGGNALVTVSGISQISRYDMNRWGDYWRFTSCSILKAFSEVFGEKNVIVNTYGNVLAAIALLEGIAAEELSPEELNFKDEDYQVTLTVVAKKYDL